MSNQIEIIDLLLSTYFLQNIKERTINSEIRGVDILSKEGNSIYNASLFVGIKDIFKGCSIKVFSDKRSRMQAMMHYESDFSRQLDSSIVTTRKILIDAYKTQNVKEHIALIIDEGLFVIDKDRNSIIKFHYWSDFKRVCLMGFGFFKDNHKTKETIRKARSREPDWPTSFSGTATSTSTSTFYWSTT